MYKKKDKTKFVFKFKKLLKHIFFLSLKLKLILLITIYDGQSKFSFGQRYHYRR